MTGTRGCTVMVSLHHTPGRGYHCVQMRAMRLRGDKWCAQAHAVLAQGFWDSSPATSSGQVTQTMSRDQVLGPSVPLCTIPAGSRSSPRPYSREDRGLRLELANVQS